MPAASNERKSAAAAVGGEERQLVAQEISPAEQRGRAAIEAMLALRDSGCIKPVTLEEILAWRHEGHGS